VFPPRSVNSMITSPSTSASHFQVNEGISSSPSNPPFLPIDSDETPDAVLLLANGVPGYQYTIVDPANQYQKYLIVVLQGLSGTDPTNPPRYSPVLVEDGNTLQVKVPIAPVMISEEMMTDGRVSWMREGGGSAGYHQQYRNTRLAGLGPAVAQINGHFNGKPLTTTWDLPLIEPCEKLIGNYSINNFPAEHGSGRFGASFSPVVVEFKLSTVEQRVKKQSRVSSGLWEDEGLAVTEARSSLPHREDGSFYIRGNGENATYHHSNNASYSSNNTANKHP
jgi:hypothetical protein